MKFFRTVRTIVTGIEQEPREQIILRGIDKATPGCSRPTHFARSSATCTTCGLSGFRSNTSIQPAAVSSS